MNSIKNQEERKKMQEKLKAFTESSRPASQIEERFALLDQKQKESSLRGPPKEFNKSFADGSELLMS